MKNRAIILVLGALMASSCTDGTDDIKTSCDPETGSCGTVNQAECTNDTWTCDENTLYKCVDEKWEVGQTCDATSQCNADKGTCAPISAAECTNDTWTCDENTLYKCVGEKWKLSLTCDDDTLCNAKNRSCDPNVNAECTSETWECHENSLYKCVSGKWKFSLTCDEDMQCNSETRACEIKCLDTEHHFLNTCEADDVTHCGTHTNDCTKISGWKSGSCIEKTCITEECKTGYHLASIFDGNKEKTICEEDTHEACGSINTQCGTEEICTQGKCKDKCQPGEVICGGSCIDPMTSRNFCGADVSCSSYIPCSEFEECIGGKCVLASCQNEEESLCTETEQNICVNVIGSNSNHCGACEAACKDKETAKTTGCDHGKCTYTCNDNMLNCGSATEPLCLPKEQFLYDPLHCGNCNTKCAENEFCQEGQCIVSSCTGNECLYDNTCINQNEHCGTQCLNCNTANLASAGLCQGGSCVITACIAGYHLTSEGVCEIDSAEACPNGNTTKTVNCNTLDEYTKAGSCVKAKCQATACQSNAHLKDGKCIADSVDNCGTAETDCTAIAGWQSGECVEGKCVAATCASGYCLNNISGKCTNEQSISACGIDGDLCQSCNPKQVCAVGKCEDKQCDGNVCNQTTDLDETLVCTNDDSHCGSGCQDCNSFTNHATGGICKADGTCQVTDCETGFHLYNNACEEDSVKNCGEHGTVCNVENAANTCSEGKCTFICDSNYHLYNDTCEPDSVKNCGEHGTQCNVENASNECINKSCTFTCGSNYHLYNDACEADSTENCGTHGTQCNVENANNQCINKACTYTCNDDHHLYNDACEADSIENCGSHGTGCKVENATSTCSEGKCTFTCDTGYHEYNDACEEDSTENCGAHGTSCKVENATSTCSEGKCTFACDTGYHEYNDACEEDSIENCGKHENTCTTGYKCEEGACVALPAVGEIITFGHYEQDNDTTNGKEPIEWRVLAVNNSNQLLVISEKVLDAKPYNTKQTSITWENSTIRSWLNGYEASYNTYGTDYTSDNFIDNAFTSEEQAKIVESSVPAHSNPRYLTSPGNATTDKILLLSIIEATNYFTDDSNRQADATRYAVKQGVYVKDSESWIGSIDGSCTNVHCYALWWLRSPGDDIYDAANVNPNGSIKYDGYLVYYSELGVRPALWLNY